MSVSINPLRLLVVGGHTRNIGKTALVVDLIRAFPEISWTAVKITQHGHGTRSPNGAAREGAPGECAVALDAETDPSGGKDSSRFLAAGAARSFWLRAEPGRLDEGLPLLRSLFADSAPGAATRYAILESNSILQFVQPTLYLVVLDPSRSDFKVTARQVLDRADAFVLRAGVDRESPWPEVASRLLHSKPCFAQPLGGPLPARLVQFVRERFLSGRFASF